MITPCSIILPKNAVRIKLMIKSRKYKGNHRGGTFVSKCWTRTIFTTSVTSVGRNNITGIYIQFDRSLMKHETHVVISVLTRKTYGLNIFY